jgi:hypothetical protein
MKLKGTIVFVVILKTFAVMQLSPVMYLCHIIIQQPVKLEKKNKRYINQGILKGEVSPYC